MGRRLGWGWAAMKAGGASSRCLSNAELTETKLRNDQNEVIPQGSAEKGTQTEESLIPRKHKQPSLPGLTVTGRAGCLGVVI